MLPVWNFLRLLTQMKDGRNIGDGSERLPEQIVGQRRRMPMTRLADELLRQSLGSITDIPPILHLCEEQEEIPNREHDAA